MKHISNIKLDRFHFVKSLNGEPATVLIPEPRNILKVKSFRSITLIIGVLVNAETQTWKK